MSNFIGLVYATLKNEGVDTKGMSADEAVAKYDELQKKSGGKGGENEPTPAESRKINNNKNNAKELPKEKYSIQEQNKIDYLKDKINNSWYANAKKDYGVNGKVEDISIKDDKMTIIVNEDGKKLKSTINYISDYTPEQLYNIWQEFPED